MLQYGNKVVTGDIFGLVLLQANLSHFYMGIKTNVLTDEVDGL